MKLRTLALLLTSLVLTACGGHSSRLSSDTSSESSFSLSTSESSILSSETTSSSGPITNEYYDGYYHDLTSWSNGEDLKQKLYDISRKTYKPLNYTAPNYQTNIQADHTYKDYEFLDVIYSETDCAKGETNKGWQREHAFCASLMCGTLTANAVKRVGRATDFHNLLAADASANSSRGNKNYGNADTSNPNYQNRTTGQGRDGYSFDPKNFEPGDNDKGRVARAIFYMAMMYKNDEVDEVNGLTMKGLRILEEPVTYVQGEEGAFAIGNLSTLLEWNNEYPVDYLEMQHNISVYKDINDIDGYAQGNRNPFVDFPDLANYVYGEYKNNGGSISSCTASESYLKCASNNTEVNHFALKSAKRAYAPGEMVKPADYSVVKILNNYTYETVTEGITHSLSDHTFSDSDGSSILATISIANETIVYRITLNPLASCSTGEIFLNTSGINKTSSGQDQEVKYGDMDFLFNYVTSANGTMTINNINQDGVPVGVTIGSGTKPLTKFVLKTKNSYKINAAYIKAFVGNTNSQYRLTIKVGEQTLLAQTIVNNKDVAKIYGTSLASNLEGQLTYIFEGSSSLKINSVAFNIINA